MENSMSNNSRNGWFQSLKLGKKNKCPCPSQNKNEEIPPRSKKDETSQANVDVNKQEEGKPHANFNPTDGNKIEDRCLRECPGKIFPIEKRGCGFHLYFCIDNIRKSDLVKNKQTNQTKFENKRDEGNCKFVEVKGTPPKETCCYDDKSSNLIKRVPSNQTVPCTKNPKDILTNRNAISRKCPSDEVRSPTRSPERTIKAYEKESTIKKGEIHSSLSNTSLKINRINSTLSNTSPRGTARNDVAPGFQKIIRFSSTDAAANEVGVNNQGQKGYPAQPNLGRPVSEVGSEAELAVLKEREAFKSFASKRKSTMQSGNTIVRNSLISIRRKTVQRKDSLNEYNMVSEVLSKLNHIEDKIAELEKRAERKGEVKNIVGISCNSAKSSGSFVTEIDETNKLSSRASSPKKSNGQIVIKVCGDDIVVSAPERGRTNKRNRSGGGVETGELVYHNTQELDAHNIASNSLTKLKSSLTQHENDKPISKTYSPTTGHSKKQDSQNWRRISEELKF